MKLKLMRQRLVAAVLCVGCVGMIAGASPKAVLLRAGGPHAQEPGSAKKSKGFMLRWDPPNLDVGLRSRVTAPACDLSEALRQAGARANELVDNLQNFTAQEEIEYHALNSNGSLRDAGAGTFDYVVIFQQSGGGTSVQESRNPAHGSKLFPASTRDVGLPALALIFTPELQADYDMNCEATVKWNNRPVWVVKFQQRRDKPSHTVAFRDEHGVYPTQLRGRAWIDTESGQVMHLETALMTGISAMHVREWYLSADYAPVKFRAQKVNIWLPSDVDAYCEFDEYRTITAHAFSNFMLFSVHTDQQIEKPQTPQ